MKLVAASILGVAALAAAVPALAQTANSTPGTRIDNREARQESRIAAGSVGGGLTPGEAARDQRHLTSIDDQEARMRARDGGDLTGRDRRVLNGRLDANSARIYRTRHNGRRG